MSRVRSVLFLIFFFSIPLLSPTVYAGCPDGGAGNDTITCDESPPADFNDDSDIDAGEGDDTVIVENGDDTDGNPTVPTHVRAVEGDGLADSGDPAQNAGDDLIVNNSTGEIDLLVGDYVDDDGGDDTIVNNGNVGYTSVGGEGNDTFTAYEDGILGDAADGNGGDDRIVNDGWAANLIGDDVSGDGGNDTIVNQNHGFAGNVCGDRADSDGGDDNIRNDGRADNVTGDCAGGNGGDDLIVNNGEAGWINGDDVEGDGGDDTIINNESVNRINGDQNYRQPTSDGGNDSIVNNDDVWAEGIYGDDVSDDGGDDTIFNNVMGDIYGDIMGDYAGYSDESTGNGGDDSLVNRGWVGGSIFGDAVDGEGGDDTILNSGTVDHTVAGDVNQWFDNSGPNNGGDDVMTNTATGRVGGEYTCYDEQQQQSFDCAFGIVGDDVDGDGGNDSITNAGWTFYLTGDQAQGDGGDDNIVNSGQVEGWIEGDGAHGDGGDDNIFNSGRAREINGDAVYGNGGNDTIVNSATGYLEQGINGDGAGWPWNEPQENFESDGGDDSIVNAGTARWINGDDARGNGGDDTIIIESTGVVVENVSGDGVGWGNPEQNPEADGGDDYIANAGTVGGWIQGDDAANDGGNDTIINTHVVGGMSGDWAGWFSENNASATVQNGPTAQGGDDSLYNAGTGTVDGDVYGDNMQSGDGGSDTINNAGFVDGSLVGDAVSGSGGDDVIINNGIVDGSIGGDWAKGNGGDDSIVHNGVVNGNIEGDGVEGAEGDDTIIVSGYVGGAVWADSAAVPAGVTVLVELTAPQSAMVGDDSVVLKNGASGYDDELYLNGGDGTDTLTLDFTAPNKAAYDQLVIDVETARLAWAASPTGSGTITFLGQTYVWDAFEELVALLSWARHQGADRATIETEETTEHPLTDGRLNYMHADAPAIIYCADGGVLILNPQGAPLLFAALADVTAATQEAILTNAPVLVMASGGVTLTALPSGMLQVVHLTSGYSFSFMGNACGVTAATAA